MPQLIGALWVRPVSLVSNKSMCFVVFVTEKQNAWSGLYDAKKEITYAIYVFKKNWCLGALLISILYYSCRTLLMYLKLLCLFRVVFLLFAGDKSGYAVEHGIPKSPRSFRALGSHEILLWLIDCSSVRERGNRRNYTPCS